MSSVYILVEFITLHASHASIDAVIIVSLVSAINNIIVIYIQQIIVSCPPLHQVRAYYDAQHMDSAGPSQE